MSGLGKLTNRRGGGEEKQYCRVTTMINRRAENA